MLVEEPQAFKHGFGHRLSIGAGRTAFGQFSKDALLQPEDFFGVSALVGLAKLVVLCRQLPEAPYHGVFDVVGKSRCFHQAGDLHNLCSKWFRHDPPAPVPDFGRGISYLGSSQRRRPTVRRQRFPIGRFIDVPQTVGQSSCSQLPKTLEWRSLISPHHRARFRMASFGSTGQYGETGEATGLPGSVWGVAFAVAEGWAPASCPGPPQRMPAESATWTTHGPPWCVPSLCQPILLHSVTRRNRTRLSRVTGVEPRLPAASYGLCRVGSWEGLCPRAAAGSTLRTRLLILRATTCARNSSSSALLSICQSWSIAFCSGSVDRSIGARLFRTMRDNQILVRNSCADPFTDRDESVQPSSCCDCNPD
jgi:hypothetical protein